MLDTSNNPKTNFWDYVGKLFNTSLTNDIGLTGNATPSLLAQPLTYNTTHKWWEATGLPLTPYNDDGSKNYYPMVNVTAKDASGNTLATTKVVLPVSDEMDCKVCHSSTSGYVSAKPTSGWENDSNAEKDFKFNILKLHDQKFPTAVSDNQMQVIRQEQHLAQISKQAPASRHISISKLSQTDASTTTKAKTAQHQDQTSIDQNMVGPKVIAIKLDSTR